MPEGFDEFPDYLRHPVSMETIINTDSRLGQHDSLRGKFAGRFHCSGRICRMAGAPHRADTGDRGISGRGMVRLRLGGWQGPLVDQVSSG